MARFPGYYGSRPLEGTAVPCTPLGAPGRASPPEAVVEARHEESKTSVTSNATRTWDFDESTKQSVEVVETTTNRTETVLKRFTRFHPYA